MGKMKQLENISHEYIFTPGLEIIKGTMKTRGKEHLALIKS